MTAKMRVDIFSALINDGDARMSSRSYALALAGAIVMRRFRRFDENTVALRSTSRIAR